MKLCFLGSEGMRGMCYKKNITNTVLICDKIGEALVVLLSPFLN